jgi:hypothetical protein
MRNIIHFITLPREIVLHSDLLMGRIGSHFVSLQLSAYLPEDSNCCISICMRKGTN